MKASISSTERIKELGFPSAYARHLWIDEHKEEILAYTKEHTLVETLAHFKLSATTLKRLRDIKHEKKDKRPSKAKKSFEAVSPKALANAILDKLTVLQSENLVLKEQNSNLKTRLDYLEGQEAERKEVGKKAFQTKLTKVMAFPGE